MKRPYYRVCPDCGARLDPGERCDCWDKYWKIEVRMPNGDTITTRISGPEDRVRAHYAAQGGKITKMEEYSQ